MMDLPSIHTARLILDAMTEADWSVVHAEWGDERVARMTATVQAGWSEEEARDWIRGRATPSAEGYSYAIRRKTDRRLLGSVGMGGVPKNLGYLLGRAWWGQGYGSEAVAAFLANAYATTPELDKIEAGVFDDNPASARILVKLGFQRVGEGDCTSLSRLEPAANSLYRLTRAQFEAWT